MRVFFLRFFFLFLSIAVVSSCEKNPWIEKGKTALLKLFYKKTKPSPVVKKKSPKEIQKEKLKKALYQMMEAVLVQKVSKTHYGELLGALEQGASLEGIYQGLVRNQTYRKLEATYPGATPRALRVFGMELAYLAKQLKVVPHFEKKDTGPLPQIQVPKPEPNDQVRIERFIDFTKESAPKKKQKINWDLLAENYAKQFIGSSLFTLKRVLGEVALKTLEEHASYAQKLALWYSKWAMHLSSYGIELGFEGRAISSENRLYPWALHRSPDWIRFEVLLRLHQLLNHANKRK